MKTIKEIFREHAVFDSEGRHVNGTDKESNHHYGTAYEQLIYLNQPGNPLVDHGSNVHAARADVKLMMEVGVADGSSLRAWREVFPNALIVGMDIHHSDKAHGDRIEFCIGDQRSQRDCGNAAAGRFFDVIVEDATHEVDANLLTLFWLWPWVKPGGLYIIEEFANVGANRHRIMSLWPSAEIVGTCGPSGQDEPLVVFRKPL
jgi:hypothetical protein